MGGSTGNEVAKVLLNAVLPLAERMLHEFGEFHPYGGAVQANGEIVDVAVDSDNDASGSTQQMIELLNAEFTHQASAGKLIACAVVSDVRIDHPDSKTKTDAIRVCLDCEDGYSVELFKPYALNRHDRSIEFSNIIIREGTRQVFPTQ